MYKLAKDMSNLFLPTWPQLGWFVHKEPTMSRLYWLIIRALIIREVTLNILIRNHGKSCYDLRRKFWVILLNKFQEYYGTRDESSEGLKRTVSARQTCSGYNKSKNDTKLRVSKESSKKRRRLVQCVAFLSTPCVTT